MLDTTPWTADQIPDLDGKTAIVTGANSGLGFETAFELARNGAQVVLACRNLEKAAATAESIRTAHPQAAVESLQLDLADLASVRAFSGKFLSSHRELHLLCNNAGVMALPLRRTADGFEMQFGTNHLGHFALTGLLLEPLMRTSGARVVTTSSTAHKIGRMNFSDLQSERSYSRVRAYGQSKLANLLFAYELQRRLAANGAGTISLACHPGYAATNLQLAAPRMTGSSWMERTTEWANGVFAQSAAMGALPTLYAATSPGARGGDYIGPSDYFESWGHPKKVQSNGRSHDAEAAHRLWDISETLTGVRFDWVPRATERA
jgi:NAD(P)-dependent dehydrogenase (short-subunit alcohol dehydrogenase family)